MGFISDLETNIGETLPPLLVKMAFHDWAHSAWYTAAEYVRDNYTDSTHKGAIGVGRVITSSDTGDVTHAYWGLDHIEAAYLRLKILDQTSLFAYYGAITKDPTKDRFFVVSDTNIYRFVTDEANVYFNGARTGIIDYTAAGYHAYNGDTAAETASNAAGDTALGDYFLIHLSE